MRLAGCSEIGSLGARSLVMLEPVRKAELRPQFTTPYPLLSKEGSYGPYMGKEQT